MHDFKYKKIRMVLVLASMAFVQDLQHLMTPLLSQIQNKYIGVPVSWIQLLVTGPSFFAVFISLISGRLVFRFSKKSLLLFSGLLTGIAGIVSFAAVNFPMLLLGRFLYGAGLGISSALNVAIVASCFAGDERIWAMGIQSASVGTGMVAITFLSGVMGKNNFRYSFLLYGIGLLSFCIVGVCLPGTEEKKEKERQKIKLPGELLVLGGFGFFMFLFLASFSTNIAMHMGGEYRGNSAAAGAVTAVFAIVQVVLGFCLGRVIKITKQYTLMAAMGFFVVGAAIITGSSSWLPGLFIGAALCGMTQGLFIPAAMIKVSDIAKGDAAVMASAVFNCFVCMGQALSPAVLNLGSRLIFGTVDTEKVFLIAAAGMAASAVLQGLYAGRPGIGIWRKMTGRK